MASEPFTSRLAQIQARREVTESSEDLRPVCWSVLSGFHGLSLGLSEQVPVELAPLLAASAERPSGEWIMENELPLHSKSWSLWLMVKVHNGFAVFILWINPS